MDDGYYPSFPGSSRQRRPTCSSTCGMDERKVKGEEGLPEDGESTCTARVAAMIGTPCANW